MACDSCDVTVKSVVSETVYSDALEIAETNIDWNRLTGKSVLITGAAGFIGGYLVFSLLTRNDLYDSGKTNVLALVRNKKKAEKKFGLLLNRSDLTTVEADVTQKFSCPHADFIIHAASPASGIDFESIPSDTIGTNLIGTLNVLDFALKCKSEAVLVVSSLKVYGALYTGRDKIREDDEGCIDFTSYKSCYAEGKRASETIAACCAKQYGLNIKVVRPSYIYGASRLDDDRVWAQFIANTVRGENILLKSNGSALRSFCYVTDTARAMLYVLLCGENNLPYNISCEMSDVTIRDFAEAVCGAFPERGLKLRFANPDYEAEPIKMTDGKTPEILDNSRLKALGWLPQVGLTQGIRRSVKTLEENLS